MRLIRLLTAMSVLTAPIAASATLKIRSIETRPLKSGQAAARASSSFAARHAILTVADRERMEAADLRPIAEIPGVGWIVSAPAGTELAPLDPASKLSPDLNREGDGSFLVEFFPDTAPGQREARALENGFSVLDRPDISPVHLLLEGSAERLLQLAAADEVAYVFAASEELVRGEPVFACQNAATGTAGAGQYLATYGEGWDGPGAGAASLTFTYQRLTDKLPLETTHSIIASAMAEWSKHIDVRFVPSGMPNAARNLNFLFGSGQHGDICPFDGPGRTLAHTYYPAPPNSEPFAGDLHFDADERWNAGVDIDLFSVVLHEIGHALGLGHADLPNAVMYPYYKRVTALGALDVEAARRLYAAGGATAPREPEAPPSQPGVPPPPVTPETPPSTPAAADSAAPVISITTPAGATASTSRNLYVIAGRATDNVGVARIQWSTNTGRSGIAVGTAQWQAEIPLVTGYNVVVVRAFDAAGNSSWRAAGITRLR